MKKTSLVLVFAFVFSLAASTGLVPQRVFADTLGAMTGYQVPYGLNLQDIVEGEPGVLWFTQSHFNTKRIWKFDSNAYDPLNPNAAFTSYAVSGVPTFIVYGPDDTAYAILATYGKIARIKANGWQNTDLSLPSTWAAQRLVLGSDGSLWVAAQYGTGKRLFNITPDGEVLAEYTGPSAGSEITGLIMDYMHGKVWVLTRSYTYPPGTYTTYATSYSTVDGTAGVTHTLGIASVSQGVVAPNGVLWVGAGNQLQSIDASETLGSVTTIPYSAPGIAKMAVGPDGQIWASLSQIDKVVRIDQSGTATYTTGYVPGGNGSTTARPLGITAASDGNMWITQYNNGRITKIGTGVSGSGLDTDMDGLGRSDEIAQGTSDYTPDSDADGLSDYVESTSYTNRDSVFCNTAVTTCEYPDPLVRDVYVEADWMVRPGSPSVSFQATSSQVAVMAGRFDDHGINLHVDYGQLDGANEVPYNDEVYYHSQSSQIDLHDYKYGSDGITTAQFNPNRLGIYHYMLLGDRLAEDTDVSGENEIGDDDGFIAAGGIYDMVDANPSTYMIGGALVGTYMHELGHGLCLSSANSNVPVYNGQPASCRFAGVHGSGSSFPNYLSVMVHGSRQYTQLDYSDGQNGTNDHDDWGALRPQDSFKYNAAHGDAG